MDQQEWLAERFELSRRRLTAIAYRMLGSPTEADDAVQDAWLRVSRSGADDVENLDGWLTTVVARICLNMLRSRAARREDPVGVHVPDPVIGRLEEPDPADEALLSDSVSRALIVVLDTLPPAERLAFVLHDMFDVSFKEIAALVGRSTVATRQLASRARRRVRTAQDTAPSLDAVAQRRVVDAFFTAARDGDLDALVALLDSDAALRADGGAAIPQATARMQGAVSVARRAVMFHPVGATIHPELVNGTAGALVTRDGTLISVMGFTLRGEKIVGIDILLDPARLARIDLALLDT